MKRIISILIVMTLVLTFGAGNAFAAGEGEEAPQEIELGYVNWEGEIAATYVAAVLLEEMGYDVQTTDVDAAPMWTGVGAGDLDAHLAGWLPVTHEAYLNEVEGQVEELGGPLLEGARIGLMVPTYVDIDSIEELNEHADRFNNDIVGIEPGAGIMSATEEALDVYDLDDMTLVESSDAAMQSALADAYDREEWIVVTGWTPHPKEGRHDLKYLEDPEGVFGEVEFVQGYARQGLQEEMPEAFELLSNFYWEVEDFAELMEWNAEGDPYENAQRWVEENRDLVETWMP